MSKSKLADRNDGELNGMGARYHMTGRDHGQLWFSW